MTTEQRITDATDRCTEFFQQYPEEQSTAEYRAWMVVADLLNVVNDLQREKRRTERQSDERAARAWDKGYGAGHHDGRWHDTMRLSSTPREDKGRRNPYRFSGGAGCGCYGGAS